MQNIKLILPFTCKSFAIRLTAGVARKFDDGLLFNAPVSMGAS
jgi:hypothetical protein